MSNKVKADVAVSEDIVTTEKFQLSDLWKKEDWLAVWIGFRGGVPNGNKEI